MQRSLPHALIGQLTSNQGGGTASRFVESWHQWPFRSLLSRLPDHRVTGQVTNPGPSLLVPITGVADAGGMFNGALFIERFAQQASGVAAVGTVTGALTEAGTVRNLVMQVTLPLDFDAIRARLDTDAALAQASW